MLEALGVSATAEAVYRTMLRHRAWGVQQVADHLGLSMAEVRDALDLLAGLSLLTLDETSAALVSPEIGLSALLAQAEHEAMRRREQIDATRAAIATIAADHTDRSRCDTAIRLEGRDAVRARAAQLAAGTARECLAMHPQAMALHQQMPDHAVAVRCLYQESVQHEPGLLAQARLLSSLGGQPRITPVVPMPMVIYDREVVLVPLDPADAGRGALELRSPGVIALACALFEQLWSSSRPLGATADRDQSGLDCRERQLLSLLAAGHTDEHAARRLGVSITTIRRMMAALMLRLNARSRFQAGLQVAERGWLHAP